MIEQCATDGEATPQRDGPQSSSLGADLEALDDQAGVDALSRTGNGDLVQTIGVPAGKELQCHAAIGVRDPLSLKGCLAAIEIHRHPAQLEALCDEGNLASNDRIF